MTRERLNDVLHQGTPSPGDGFVADFLAVCLEIRQVTFPQENHGAYAIDVRPPDLPTVVKKNGAWVMVKRSGSDGLPLDSLGAIGWMRQQRRGVVLRGCCEELHTFPPQLSNFRPVPDGIPERLPYLTSVMEDGTPWRLLTDDDRTALVDRAVQGGRLGGAADLYYKVVTRVEVALRGTPQHPRNLPLRNLPGLDIEFANLEADVRQTLSQLATYVPSQGFPLAETNP